MRERRQNRVGRSEEKERRTDKTSDTQCGGKRNGETQKEGEIA